MLEAEALRGEEASVNGVRITAAKYERWEKRARTDEEQKSTRTKDLVGASDTPCSIAGSDRLLCTLSTELSSTPRREQSSDLLIMSPSTRPEDQANSFPRHDSPEAHRFSSLAVSSTKATNPGFSGSTLPVGSFEPVEFPPGACGSCSTVQEPEHDFIWPNPKQTPDSDTKILTRLFSALNMDPGSISYNPPVQVEAEVLMPTTDTVCLQDLEAHVDDDQVVPWIGEQTILYETISSGSVEVTGQHDEETPQQGAIISVSYQCSSRKRTTTGALKYPSVDVIFSSSRVVELDPFSLEVYPFPQDQGRPLEVQPIVTLYDSHRMDMNDCIAKINKLESVALGSNAAATELRWDLAGVYHDLGYHDESIYQYKQILPALEQIYGQNSWYYILAKIHLAGPVLRLGRSQEGNQIAQEAYVLARRFYPDSSLYQEATSVLAGSLGFLDDRTGEEELLKEVVQIRLTVYGPKHGGTITAIRQFCEVIKTTRGYSESEELLRVALELSSNATNISDREQCTIRSNLGWLLYRQHKYTDSVALIREAAKMSEIVLGIEHRYTLGCKNVLCKVLKTRRLLLESHDILLEVIEVQIKKMKEIRGGTIKAMANLSVVLIEMRNIDDAYKWMKQALCYCVEIGGIESDRAEQFFEDLSSIDDPEEQHELILDLYDRMRIDIDWLHAVRYDLVLFALSPQPCFLLLDS